MADFQTSTHRARWIFTPEELNEKYRAANHRARQTLEKKLHRRILEGLNLLLNMLPEVCIIYPVNTILLNLRGWLLYGATGMEVHVDGSLLYHEAKVDAKDNAENHSRPKPLKIEEEQLLRAFYEFKIQESCDAFGFPRKIQATALIYFKRFYLQWSVMEQHPKHIMLTCIYAACKAEENHVSAEELGKALIQDHQIILNNEMLVLQSLGFDLIVYAPYRALEGFFCDIEEFIQVKNEQLQMLKDLHETSKKEIDKTMLTDGPLLFPPGQLALAALRRSNKLHGVLDFERYLGSILSRRYPTRTTSDVTASLNEIDLLVSKLQMPSRSDMKHVDRKLRLCREPGSHDKSKKRKHRSKDGPNAMQALP